MLDNFSDRETCHAGRRAAMALFARASASELAAGLSDCPPAQDLRPVEAGLVMLRGRIGGDGAPFNLGEATVTRAAVRIDSGEAGFAYILGREQAKARLAAWCDALWQNPVFRAQIERDVLAPVRARLAAEHMNRAARTAATKVDFFTLVRGED